jgi:Sec7-like guanine-nucleotide exchange factor
MRELLEAFRLPGESQQIARITETFASIYFASGPGKLLLDMANCKNQYLTLSRNQE